MEFLLKLLQLPLAEQVANLHGLLAILSLLMYGSLFTVILLYKKFKLEDLHKPLLYLLGIQTLIITAISMAGIVAYIAYRAPGGAREFLLSSANTNWLHNIAFEYKEYLCGITPWLLLMVAFFVAARLGSTIYKNRAVLRLLLACVAVSVLFVLLTATMAVLVAKIAPLGKFMVGNDLFPNGGLIVIGATLLTVIVIAGLFSLINFVRKPSENRNINSVASMMYGSSAGLTMTWVLNMAQEANFNFKQSIAYLPSVGPYGGVIIWSLVTVVVVTLILWLATSKIKKEMPVVAAGWVLIISALIQIVAFFPPFYHLFIR